MLPKGILESRLGLDLPIVQAPMIVQKSLILLAAAVSNAGGLGSLGCAEMSLDKLDQSISEMREITDGPFNLNFFLHKSPIFDAFLDIDVKNLVAPFYEKLELDIPNKTDKSSLGIFDNDVLSLLIQRRPAMVSFHFGCPPSDTVQALKSAKIVTAATATTVQEAITLQNAGLDIVVAQGWEAGGHRGSFQTNYEDTGIGTFALIPQIVDAVDIPVLAAGGIGDGRGIAAALALGAQGVWMGTAFLSCSETPITPIHRQALLNATDEDTHLSRAFSGRPCRAKKNTYSECMAKSRPRLQDFPLMYNYSGPLKKFGIANDDLDYQFLLYGQAAALNKDLTAAQLIEKLKVEARQVLKELSDNAASLLC